MRRKHVIGALALLACSRASGGEVESQVQQAMNQLASKARECKAVVKDALGTPFEEQLAKAMEELKKDPKSLKAQLQVIEILAAHADRLHKSLNDAKGADLASMRDRVVQGLSALAKAKQSEKDRYLGRAKESSDPEWKRRYQELAGVCDRLGQAYAARVEQYKAVPITQQLVQIQLSIEYLSSVKDVLASLRDGIQTILSDEAALRELQRLSVTVDGIQASLKTFSEVVLAGALAGDEQPVASNTKS